MKRVRTLLSRVSTLFAARQLDDELDEEIRAHLDLLADEHQKRGLSPAEARAAALRDFGGVARTKESYRDQRGLVFIETLLQDLRYAIRMARRAPGFSAVVDPGAGARHRRQQRDVHLRERAALPPAVRPRRRSSSVSTATIRRSRIRTAISRIRTSPTSAIATTCSSELIAYTFSDGRPARAATSCSASFVEVVSVELLQRDRRRRGGGTRASRRTKNGRARISRWRLPATPPGSRRGFDPAFVGRTLRINVRDFTIVGVAPKGFAGTTAIIAPELWVPFGVFDSVVQRSVQEQRRRPGRSGESRR